MLELDHVTIAYRETQAVEDFSLHMEPGEIVSLVGESGSGKTSVIRGILGLLPGGGAVTQGNIVFDGKDLLDVTPEQWRTVGELALRLHRALDLGVYSRADFILDEEGSFWCLEINTLPGMTPTSLVPQEAAQVGLSYGDLCQRIVDESLALRKGGRA